MDWIKMRTDLYRDPKIIGIAELLMDPEGPLARFVSQHCQSDMTVTHNVLRNVTVGALVSVWGIARHQGNRVNTDLVLRGCELSALDAIADIPGFGEAMFGVGWVVEVEDGLCFPKFFAEHNTDPKERAKQKNRERQRRYRDRHHNVTDNVTVTHREEKSREENKREGAHARNGKFSVPTIEEVRAYVAELGYTMDPEKFWHHFEANGWRTRTGPLKSWKSAVVNWQKNEHAFAGTRLGKPADKPPDAPYYKINARKFAALEAANQFAEVTRNHKTPTHISGITRDGMRYECIDYPLATSRTESGE